MKRQTVVYLILALSFLLLDFTSPAFALTPSEVFEKVKDSVLIVKVFDAKDKPKSQGSGVMLPSGKVATNCHVVRNGERFQVGRGEKFIPATLHAVDADKDVCLLEVNGLSAMPVQLGKAAALKVGEAVYAVGSPRGLELSLSDGIVSQLRGATPPIIQTTTAISPGSSGGGLFDAEGRLVGITTFYLEGGQSLNFALPVEWVANIQSGNQRITETRSYTDWLARAVVLEEKNDWQQLLHWSRQWTRADQSNALAWISLGDAYLGLKRYTDAIGVYREALRIRPDYSEAWYNLGVTYGKLDRHTEAIEAFREVLRIRPDDAETLNNLGISYEYLKRHTAAINAYREALRIRPDYSDAWYNLGVTYGRLDRHTEAIEASREALRVKPDLAEAWYNLGVTYGKLDRHTEAIEAFRETLRVKPDLAEAWYGLGLAYVKLDRYSDAIKAFREAVRIKPDLAEAWSGLAAAYTLSGNRGAALEAVRELRRYDPKEADKLFNLIMPK